jgi:hypothetical protein
MFTLLKHVHGYEVSAVLLYEEEVDWSYAQKSPSMSRHIATGIFKTTGLSIPCGLTSMQKVLIKVRNLL